MELCAIVRPVLQLIAERVNLTEKTRPGIIYTGFTSNFEDLRGFELRFTPTRLKLPSFPLPRIVRDTSFSLNASDPTDNFFDKFQERYRLSIKYGYLPLLFAGGQYYPLEYVDVVLPGSPALRASAYASLAQYRARPQGDVRLSSFISVPTTNFGGFGSFGYGKNLMPPYAHLLSLGTARKRTRAEGSALEVDGYYDPSSPTPQDNGNGGDSPCLSNSPDF